MYFCGTYHLKVSLILDQHMIFRVVLMRAKTKQSEQDIGSSKVLRDNLLCFRPLATSTWKATHK